MRFHAGGPALPDALLIARDEGQVVFFCGAGVSRARAGLSDFYGLARNVVEHLGSTSDSPARKLIEAAAAQTRIAGVGGLLPADRVFALLEREFEVADVREAVARALKPDDEVDLSAHRIMLDLARGPDHQVRLVTTNFDVLFEACNPSLPAHAPPLLPDPRHDRQFRGIVHLHGRVNPDYSGASDDEFVLSSADFGRAYLADGWATSFIQTMLSRRQIVFVGYTADDPPVQYLLEALNGGERTSGGLYAFQEGAPDEARALWAAKGVQAIPYDPANGHAALWRTLEAWAERARDPAAWTDRLLARAAQGPLALEAHGRGQIKHLVSTTKGARAFANSQAPAEWLCAFDPAVRYGTPSRTIGEVAGVDPFDLYGLDDDQPPPPTNPEAPYARRDVPSSAWNAFAATPEDLNQGAGRQAAAFYGDYARSTPVLPPRRSHLGSWLARVAHQPAAAWWAAGLRSLNPGVLEEVDRTLGRPAGEPTAVHEAWRFIRRGWAEPPERHYRAWAGLVAEIRQMTSLADVARASGQFLRPGFSVQRSFGGPPRPPPADVEVRRRDLIHVDVDYPKALTEPPVPDQALATFIAEARRALELGVDLEIEAMGFEYIALPPIHHDPNMRGDGFERSNGIAAPFFFYISLVQRLAMLDVEAARREVAAWRAGDKVFSRLKIWAAGQPDLMSASQAARALLGLDPEHFWSSRHQRDLLLTLAARWAELPAGSRATLERRILRGPPRYEGEAPREHRRSRGYAILDRVAWLEAQGCAFTVETQPALDRSRRDAPDWNAAGGVNAAASLEGRIGGVVRNTDAAALVDEAPAALLDAAETLTRREHGNLTEHRPLEGLAMARPTKLLKALVMSDRKGGVSEWGWRTLLSADAEHQRPRLRRQIAERLARLSPQHLAALTYPATDWFKAVSPDLALAAPMTRDRLWSALIEMLRAHPEVGGSAIRSSRPDWRMSALNSPSGHLAQALMADPARLPVEGEGFPAAWLSKVTELLGLGGEAGRFAAVHLLYNIVWFFHFDPGWTEAHLLGRLQGDADDQDAFWSGFLTSAGATNLALYLRLKPGMLGLVRQSRQDHDDTSALAGLLLSGWRSRDTADGERCISDMELRESLISGGDRFRGQVLWHLARWCEGPEGDWRDQALELFRSAWPRQRVVKTPKTSAELAEFAISFPGDFSALVEALVPHLTPVTADTWFLGALDNEESRRLDDQPTALLTLIWAILADTASDWPYGSAALVEKLSEAPDLTADPRLAELRRRLAAR